MKDFTGGDILNGMKIKPDLVDLNDWLTVDEAATLLGTLNVTVSPTQLYHQADLATAAGPARRKQSRIQARLIKNKLCLFQADVARYGEALKRKREAKKEKEVQS